MRVAARDAWIAREALAKWSFRPKASAEVIAGLIQPLVNETFRGMKPIAVRTVRDILERLDPRHRN